RKKKVYLGKRHVDRFGNRDGKWAVPRMLRQYYMLQYRQVVMAITDKFARNGTYGAFGQNCHSYDVILNEDESLTGTYLNQPKLLVTTDLRRYTHTELSSESLKAELDEIAIKAWTPQND